MRLSTVTFQEDQIEYLAPTWAELHEMAFGVAELITRNEWLPERVVTLAKGGWPMTRSLVDFLQVREVASMGVRFYSGINERLKEPEVYQELPVSIKGEKILLFDDVADTGHSLVFAKDYLLAHGAAEVRTATLFYKPHSVVKPDFYAAETTAWIVFQYECVETAKMLLPKWKVQGVSPEELQSRLVALGFSEELYRYYQENVNKLDI